MLERLVASTVLYAQCEKKPIPKNAGTTIYWNRYSNFTVNTIALTEGTVPTATYLSGNAVTATLFQLGAWTPTSDMLSMTSFSNVVKDCVDLMADMAATGATSGHAEDPVVAAVRDQALADLHRAHYASLVRLACLPLDDRDSGEEVVVNEVVDKNFVIISGEKVKQRRINIRHLEPTSNKGAVIVPTKKEEKPKKAPKKKTEEKK